MCVYTGPHILFIHSSINGHLGYVHILAIVNKAAISIRGHYLLKLVFLFSLDIRYNHYEKQYEVLKKKTSIELLYDSTILLLDIYPERSYLIFF